MLQSQLSFFIAWLEIHKSGVQQQKHKNCFIVQIILIQTGDSWKAAMLGRDGLSFSSSKVLYLCGCPILC